MNHTPTAVSALLLTLLSASGASAQYTMNYTINSHVQYPAGTVVEIGDVNAYGNVAFAINEPAALRGVYVYAGFVPIKVIGAGPYVAFGPPDINCQGHVAVRAQRPGGGDDMLY